MVKYIYTLGASGERIKVEELDRTVEYTYDELYRLTSETITKGKNKTTYAYEYDSVSNRTLKTVNGVETVYTYNGLNQLTGENGTTYEYDGAGNLVRVIGTGKTALYVYNANNRLVRATVQQGNNVVVETYTYDYAGNRTSKTTSTNNHVEKVYYLNDNSSLTNVLVEIGANGDEICYYTIGADLISQEIDGEVYTYIYDGHGTVRALANEKGRITDTYTYDAFGNLISSTGSTANNFLYCGEQFDSTTGLYYLRARYMDTSTGRFISQDSYAGSTSDPISLHKYLYANSNPVMYSDPSGYMSLGEVMCVSAIIGGTCGAFINVAGYLDKLVGWRNFNLSDMVQAAFEGFLDGMVVGLLFGVAFAGISYLCTVIPILSGLDTALGYAFGTYGVAKAISDGSIEAGKGNYFTASIYSIIAAISGATLLNSIYTNAHANDIGNVANNSSSATGEKSSIPTQNQTELPQNVQVHIMHTKRLVGKIIQLKPLAPKQVKPLVIKITCCRMWI
ncbi:MAG: RHS repeat domain-containing protein [Oscillospiraceae bacterium]